MGHMMNDAMERTMNEQATEWSHLPNAAHIDWIIQDVEPNPSDWDAAYQAARDAAWDADWYAAYIAARDADWYAAWDAACIAAWNAVRDAARDAAWDAAWFAAWFAARNAIQALVAYDHAGALFDIPVEQVRVQAYLGQPAAILMLPACEVRAMRDLG
jgi:hypothetical protein